MRTNARSCSSRFFFLLLFLFFSSLLLFYLRREILARLEIVLFLFFFYLLLLYCQRMCIMFQYIVMCSITCFDTVSHICCYVLQLFNCQRTSMRHAMPSPLWTHTGSNRRPPECKSGALPAELWARSLFSILVGRSGLEPPASRLSGVCSNQLSYRPACCISIMHGLKPTHHTYYSHLERCPLTTGSCLKRIGIDPTSLWHAIMILCLLSVDCSTWSVDCSTWSVDCSTCCD
jgi:hypothetical protein